LSLFIKAIPSLLTVGNLALGLLALFATFGHHTSEAALLIIIGMVLDGLDGRVARLLHAESEFGKELDSLSDIVTFGVAPAGIMYVVVLHRLGWVGMVIAMLFPICGALRLARFNVQQKSTNYFVGLPITAAGGILATMALYNDLLTPSIVILPVGMICLALLMVSSARYPNFKKVAFPRSAIVVVPVLTVCIYLLFRFHYSAMNRIIFIPLALYAVFGIGRALKRRRRYSEVDHETEALEKSVK
jgi:CDP-diacylglycerol---serine O-phosphatidyltransferase